MVVVQMSPTFVKCQRVSASRRGGGVGHEVGTSLSLRGPLCQDSVEDCARGRRTKGPELLDLSEVKSNT